MTTAVVGSPGSLLSRALTTIRTGMFQLVRSNQIEYQVPVASTTLTQRGFSRSPPSGMPVRSSCAMRWLSASIQILTQILAPAAGAFASDSRMSSLRSVAAGPSITTVRPSGVVVPGATGTA